ncbi:MAG: hypothetical protein R8M45_07605, partial [Ghiorsea sp.]
TFFFTRDKETANIYARADEGGSVIPSFVNARKLFDTRKSPDKSIFKNSFYRRWGNGAELSDKGLPDWTDSYDFVEFFEDEGMDYDGVYIHEPQGLESIAIFSPNQIKSATGNNGKFDAKNNDIRFSRSTPEQYAKDIKSESGALLNRATEGKGSNTLVSGIHHLISYAYYRPVQIIRDFGTPTARLLSDMVYKEEKNGARVLDDHDFIQRRQQKNGEFMQKVSKLIDKIDGTRAQRKKKQASIIDVLNGGTTYESMKPLAKEFRALFDEMLEYQKEAGLEIKPLDHYFPRVYDVSKLTKLGGKLAFVNMLNKAGYNGDKIWANIVENDGLYQINDTTDRFEVDKDDGSEVKKNKSASPFAGRHQNDGFTRKQSFEKQRKLDLPYADLEPFLINELDSIMGRHIHGLTTRAEYARIFGKNEGKLNKMVRDFAKEYSALPRSDKSVTLNEAIDEIYALADRLQGIKLSTGNISVDRGIQHAKNDSVMIHLGLVTLASLPETFSPAMRGGIGQFSKSMVKALGDAAVETSSTV